MSFFGCNVKQVVYLRRSMNHFTSLLCLKVGAAVGNNENCIDVSHKNNCKKKINMQLYVTMKLKKVENSMNKANKDSKINLCSPEAESEIKQGAE